MAYATKDNCPPEDIDKYLADIADGSGDALKNLYEMTSGAVYGYVLSITKNKYDAQDALHDTYVKVFQSAPNYVSQGKPMAWILTIAKNICLSKFRKDARVVVSDDVAEQFEDNAAMSAENRIIVYQCLSQLNDTERHIVILHAMSGLKHKDIAKLLGMPLATVLSKYNRAIKKLQKIFKDVIA